MQQTDRLLRGASMPEPPPGLVEAVMKRISPRQRSVVMPTPTWVRASMVVSLVLGVLFLSFLSISFLVGLAPGWEPVLVVQDVGRGEMVHSWDSVSLVFRAFVHILQALWQGLGWPWLGLLVLVMVAVAVLWWWLWRDDRRQVFLVPAKRNSQDARKEDRR
jgi:hypothetical protein